MRCQVKSVRFKTCAIGCPVFSCVVLCCGHMCALLSSNLPAAPVLCCVVSCRGCGGNMSPVLCCVMAICCLLCCCVVVPSLSVLCLLCCDVM